MMNYRYFFLFLTLYINNVNGFTSPLTKSPTIVVGNKSNNNNKNIAARSNQWSTVAMGKSPTARHYLEGPFKQIKNVNMKRYKRTIKSSNTQLQQSSVPMDYPFRRVMPVFPQVSSPGIVYRPVNDGLVIQKPKAPAKVKNTTNKAAITKMDMALFATYFCNIIPVTLSVILVPAMASEHFTSPAALAAFVGTVASMASLGGGFGKLINGFVCQRLGGRHSSWIYLVGLSMLSMAFSFTKSISLVGWMLVGYEFLSSIQWTSVCNVLDEHYRTNPELMARGIAILSLASSTGALTAKTVGAALLKSNSWRAVARYGSIISLFGALAMYTGVPKQNRNKNAADVSKSVATDTVNDSVAVAPPAKKKSALRTLFGNPLFWQVGMAHSLGYLARSNDRLLGTFIQEIASLPGHVCAGLTSCVTIGFVYGLVKGSQFSKLKSLLAKTKMVKRNYLYSVLAFLGLAFCGTNGFASVITSSGLMAVLISLCSGIMASSVSFQFYQIPNLVSSTIFSDHSAISLSLLDGMGFFVTAQVLAANSHILGNFGWSASWAFFAFVFMAGGALMSNALPTILEASEKQKQQAATVV